MNYQKEYIKTPLIKAFTKKKKNIGEMIALIHSEASEALEADRENKYCPVVIKGVFGWTDDVIAHILSYGEWS